MTADDRLPTEADWIEPSPVIERRGDAVYIRNAVPLDNPDQHLIDLLNRAARTWPDRRFLAERAAAGDGWVGVSHGDFARRVAAVAGGLRDRVAPGDRVVPVLRNSVDAAVVTFAVMALGGAVAPLAPALLDNSDGQARLGAAIRMIGASLIITETGVENDLGAPVLPLSQAVTPGARSWDLDQAAAWIQSSDPAKILFTSGSTGRPKPVVNTHGMLTASAAMVAQTLHRLPEGVLHVQVDWLPWHHTFGGNVNLHAALSTGGSVHIDQGAPTPAAFALTLRNLGEIGPTGISTVPAAFSMLLDAVKSDDVLATAVFRNLYSASSGGAALAPATVEALQTVAIASGGRRLLFGGGYGMTETAGIITRLDWPTSRHDLLGFPLPGVEIKLADQGEGRFECRVRGPNVFAGYEGDAEAPFDEEGFFPTGDAMAPATPDGWEEGFVYAGRLVEDFKLANGTWVRAGALRAALLVHLGVAVRDVLIVGEGRDRVGCLVLPGATPLSKDWLEEQIAAFNRDRRGVSSMIGLVAIFASAPNAAAGELTAKGTLNTVQSRRIRREEIDAHYT